MSDNTPNPWHHYPWNHWSPNMHVSIHTGGSPLPPITTPLPDSDFTRMKDRIEAGEFDTDRRSGLRIDSSQYLLKNRPFIRRPRIYEIATEMPSGPYGMRNLKAIVFQGMDGQEIVVAKYHFDGRLIDIGPYSNRKAPDPTCWFDLSWAVDPAPTLDSLDIPKSPGQEPYISLEDEIFRAPDNLDPPAPDRTSRAKFYRRLALYSDQRADMTGIDTPENQSLNPYGGSIDIPVPGTEAPTPIETDLERMVRRIEKGDFTTNMDNGCNAATVQPTFISWTTKPKVFICRSGGNSDSVIEFRRSYDEEKVILRFNPAGKFLSAVSGAPPRAMRPKRVCEDDLSWTVYPTHDIQELDIPTLFPEAEVDADLLDPLDIRSLHIRSLHWVKDNKEDYLLARQESEKAWPKFEIQV